MISVPAFRAMRLSFPKAEIVLIGLPWAGEFTLRFKKYIDSFLEFPPLIDLPERKSNKTKGYKLLKQIKEKHFDLLIQMHGNGVLVNSIIMQMGSKFPAGFYPSGQEGPGPFFTPFPINDAEIKKYLKLLNFLGVEKHGEYLEFLITNEDKEKFKKNSAEWNLSANYACLHAGAQIKERQWAPNNFAAIGDYLADKGFQVILTGTAGEKVITDKVKKMMHYPALDLAGKTDLGQIGLLIQNSKILISNDTGVVHIADALKTPSFAVSFLKDPSIWASSDMTLHKVIQAKKATAQSVIAGIGKFGL